MMKDRRWLLGLIVLILINVIGCENKDDTSDFMDTKKSAEGIQLEKIWSISKGRENIIVAVVDSGVDINCDLIKNNLFINELEKKDNLIDDDCNGYIDDNVSWDFYNTDNSIYDEKLYDYHGTYICTNILQIAPKISVIPVKFMSGTKGTIDDAVSAIEYAISRGATVINCSWNFEIYSEELSDIIKTNPDVIFVCAAGNSSINLDEETLYPCSYEFENVITVGATDRYGELYLASGYGSKVDLMAMGVDIEVVVPDNDITTVSGTSVATSYVSATVALMRSVDPNLTPYEIKEILVDSVNKTKSLDGKCQANGYLDIYSAVSKCEKNSQKE